MEKMKMIDNKKKSVSRMAGIERVKQRPGDLEKGQGGKLGAKTQANWKRGGGSLTPRKA